MRRPELLIPASSLEVLKTAVIYGADASIYWWRGILDCVQSKNFSMEK